MLPHYSPLKVAETFSVLAGLYPGRIDLGIGRAAGTDPMTTHALQRDRRRPRRTTSREQLAELLAYFEDTLPRGAPVRAAREVLPGRPQTPDAVAARLVAAERASGPPSSACRTRSRTSSTRAARRSPRSTGAASPSRVRRSAAHGGRRLGARRRHRRGGRRLSSSSRHGVHDAAPRPADRGPARRDAPSASSSAGERRLRAAAGRRTIVGTPERCARESRPPPTSTAPTR